MSKKIIKNKSLKKIIKNQSNIGHNIFQGTSNKLGKQNKYIYGWILVFTSSARQAKCFNDPSEIFTQCELREKTFNPIGEVKYGVNALHKFEVKVEEKKILHFWLFRLEMEERPIKVSQWKAIIFWENIIFFFDNIPSESAQKYSYNRVIFATQTS